jgi:hypothetical protein
MIEAKYWIGNIDAVCSAYLLVHHLSIIVLFVSSLKIACVMPTMLPTKDFKCLTNIIK